MFRNNTSFFAEDLLCDIQYYVTHSNMSHISYTISSIIDCVSNIYYVMPSLLCNLNACRREVVWVTVQGVFDYYEQ